MRRSMIAGALAAAVASFAGYGSASAQGVGVELYVGPPAYAYEPGPYVQYGYGPPAYGYYGYAEPSYRRMRCGANRFWNGNHCVDVNTLGSQQP